MKLSADSTPIDVPKPQARSRVSTNRRQQRCACNGIDAGPGELAAQVLGQRVELLTALLGPSRRLTRNSLGASCDSGLERSANAERS
jgi:hypothetical protein